MAVSTTDTYSGPYEANGVTVEFPFTFKAVSADDVAVIIRTADGEESFAPTSDYSVSLDVVGGSAIFSTPLDDVQIYVVSEPSFLQQIEFASGQPFSPSVVNDVNDLDVVRALYLKREMARTPRLPLGGGVDGLFPVVLPGGGWGFASGTGNDPALREDLARDDVDAGVALAAFNAERAYAAGSAGAALRLRDISVADFPFLASPTQSADHNKAAFERAIAALPAEGGLITIPAGLFYIDPGIDTMGKNISFRGAGKTATHLVFMHATADCLIISGSGSITIENITFSGGVVRTGGAFVVFDAGPGLINYGSAMVRCTFNAPYIGVDTRRNSGFTVDDCDFVAEANSFAGLVINNLTNGDSGDSAVNDCYFGQNEPTVDAVAILQGSSGGLRINNTKINGWARGYALEMEEIAEFGNTSILIINSNSIENCGECGIDLARVSGDGIFTYILIVGNEIAYCPVSIRVSDDADVFYDGIISNNVIAIAGGGKGVHLNGGNNWKVTDNIFDGVTGLATAIHVGPTARKVTLGEKTFRNISTPLIDEAPDTYLRVHGHTFSTSVTTNVADGALFAGESSVEWPAGLFAYPPKIFPTVQSGVSAVPVYTATPALTSRAVRGYATGNGVPMVCDVLVVGW